MSALLVKLILKLQASLVSFDGANGVHDSADPGLHVVVAQFAGCESTFAGIVIGKTCIPPDSGIDVIRQIEPFLVGPGSILDAHTDHEHVAKRELEEAVEIYSQMTRRLLGS